MQSTQALNQPKKAQPKLVLFLLLIVFFGPMLFAWTMYYKSNELTLGTTNKGQLISPPMQLGSFTFVDANTQDKIDVTSMQGHWSLVYQLPTVCSEACHSNLFYMRQLHTALNKEMNRVQRVFLFSPNTLQADERAQLKETYPNAAQVILDEKGLTRLLQYRDRDEAEKLGTYFVIDPLGNIMMQHEGDMPAKSILSDLKKLLKASRIG